MGDEEMEDHEEMEEDSTSNVKILETHGTCIYGNGHDRRYGYRKVYTKSQLPPVNVSEDSLNQQIQDYVLVSSERTKNVVWWFFKKYGCKKLKD
jgi:hypothetical protein